MPAAVEAELSPLAIGTKAPEFDLMASGNRRVKLSDYAGQNLVVVFYPKDQTPGCTRQLCALRDDLAMFNGLNTQVLASNPGSMASHDKFVEKQGYNFPILVDENRTMAADYHALKENGTSIQRTVYIIDGQGVVRYAQQGMPTDQELAQAIKAFG
jgi:peroxiredoxin